MKYGNKERSSLKSKDSPENGSVMFLKVISILKSSVLELLKVVPNSAWDTLNMTTSGTGYAELIMNLQSCVSKGYQVKSKLQKKVALASKLNVTAECKVLLLLSCSLQQSTI